jgi:branched-chain amino acid aminotransferase
MPVVEGVTPRILMDPARTEATEDPTGMERRDGIFALDEAALSPLDHVALYGDGVFEGILIRNRSIFLYREHIERLDRSLAHVGIGLPMSRKMLTERVLATCAEVDFPEGMAGYIRLVVTRGLGDLGINPKKCLSPTLFCIVSTIRLYSSDAYERGIPLGLARHMRRPGPETLNPNIKSNNYLNNVLALAEGTRGEGLVEALMLNRDGYVAEATVDNVFSIVKSEGWEADPGRVEIRTPTEEYCLVGITRDTVMELARQRGYRVTVRNDLLPIDFVGPGKECFMTGTGAGVMPITSIEGVEVGDGKPGVVSKGLITDIEAMMEDRAHGLPLETPVGEIDDYLSGRAVTGVR